jgi:hypothetical protein
MARRRLAREGGEGKDKYDEENKGCGHKPGNKNRQLASDIGS